MVSQAFREDTIFRALFSGGFFSKFRVQRHESDDKEAGQSSKHDPDEEMLVADNILKPAAEHARQHHAQCHEASANGVMGGFMLSSSNINHVEHVTGKAEAVTELFKGNADIYQDEIVRLGVREVHEHDVGQMHNANHRPKPKSQAAPGSGHATQETATSQGDDANGAVGKTDLTGG